MSEDKRTTIFDKVFKGRDGKLAVASVPNAPIFTWFIAMILAFFVSGNLHTLLVAVERGALFTWAWLELFQGVNYFRRALGFVVLVYILWSAVSHHILV